LHHFASRFRTLGDHPSESLGAPYAPIAVTPTALSLHYFGRVGFRLAPASEADPDKREAFNRQVAEQEAKLQEMEGVGQLRLIFPLAPVRRTDIDPPLRFSVSPFDGAATWKIEAMRLARRVDHGKLKITIKGRGCGRLPHRR
jgi:hypothetical protein